MRRRPRSASLQILAASATAFTAVKFVGVAYLLYLAMATWRQAREVTEGGLSPSKRNRVRLRTFGWQGLLSNALNPKVALYVALLDRIAASLRRRRVRQTVERATAAFLATFAVRPALERG
jgi:threonine/homoserine/homoserine lactone efflux protein